MKRTIWILTLAFMLGVILVPAVFATQPEEIRGYTNLISMADPVVYCIHSGPGYNQPDGFLDGCVVQPVKPGVAQKGTFTGHVGDREGSCEYSLRTFDLDGKAIFSMQICDGGLAGFHFVGFGTSDGLWAGSYHFDP